jgi:hypothetical protein
LAERADGAFVIQLRSNSDVRRRLRGRIEHVMSGQSEAFTSLAGLLAFMARFASTEISAAATPRTKENLHEES